MCHPPTDTHTPRTLYAMLLAQHACGTGFDTPWHTRTPAWTCPDACGARSHTSAHTHTLRRIKAYAEGRYRGFKADKLDGGSLRGDKSRMDLLLFGMDDGAAGPARL